MCAISINLINKINLIQSNSKSRINETFKSLDEKQTD